jgi:hypothetical protein
MPEIQETKLTTWIRTSEGRPHELSRDVKFNKIHLGKLGKQRLIR